MKTLLNLILLQRGDPSRYFHPDDTFLDAIIIGAILISIIICMAILGKVLEVLKYGDKSKKSENPFHRGKGYVKANENSEITQQENIRKEKAVSAAAWEEFHKISEEVRKQNYAILYSNKEWELTDRRLVNRSTELYFKKLKTKDKTELKILEKLSKENSKELITFRKSIGWDFWSDQVSIRDLYEKKRIEMK